MIDYQSKTSFIATVCVCVCVTCWFVSFIKRKPGVRFDATFLVLAASLIQSSRSQWSDVTKGELAVLKLVLNSARWTGSRQRDGRNGRRNRLLTTLQRVATRQFKPILVGLFLHTFTLHYVLLLALHYWSAVTSITSFGR